MHCDRVDFACCAFGTNLVTFPLAAVFRLVGCFLSLRCRAADLMPVVLLVDVGDKGTMGVMLNRRTGVLMGDLGEDFKSFMIQVRIP